MTTAVEDATTTGAFTAPPGHRTTRPTPGAVAAVITVEVRKLRAQTRVRVVLGVLLVAPFIYELFIRVGSKLPLETLFGRDMKTSGFALPLELLGFGGQWLLPAIVGLVCGDLFSSEDQHGTWKTVLTRSVDRRSAFLGKAATAAIYTTVAAAVLAVASTVAGVLIVGTGGLVDLGGQTVSTGAAIGLIAQAWAVALLPMYAFAALAVFFSVLTRSSILGVVLPIVVGFVMQVFSFVNGADGFRHWLLSALFVAWHGLADTPSSTASVWHALLVAAVYVAVLLGAAYLVFRRRDITGG